MNCNNPQNNTPHEIVLNNIFECRNWITLQTFTDDEGNFHSIRSERLR
jgi:hypothetical protein